MEKNGNKAGLVLIDSPLHPLHQGQLSEKTVDSVLLSFLANKSDKVTDVPSQGWREGLNVTMTSLGLAPEHEGAVREGAEYINHQLSALLNYDVSELRLKGPLAVLRSQQLKKDDFCYTKVIQLFFIGIEV